MWNVDNIEKWDPPKALQEYLPYGLMGYDNEGSPGIQSNRQKNKRKLS